MADSPNKDVLSAADLCRVYATAGAMVVWGPDDLRRHADLLDQHYAECEAILDRATVLNRRSLRNSLLAGVFMSVLTGVVLWSVWS